MGVAFWATWGRPSLMDRPYASIGGSVVSVGTAHEGRPFPGMESNGGDIARSLRDLHRYLLYRMLHVDTSMAFFKALVKAATEKATASK